LLYWRRICRLWGHSYSCSSQAVCEEDTPALEEMIRRPLTAASVFVSVDKRPGSQATAIMGKASGDAYLDSRSNVEGALYHWLEWRAYRGWGLRRK